MPCNLPFSQLIVLVCTIFYNCMACHVMVRRENLFLPHHQLYSETPPPVAFNTDPRNHSWTNGTEYMISHIGPFSYAWQPKVGSKVVLEEFKLCTYMYVIARRSILHTHYTHTHTHTHTCNVAFSSILTHLDQLQGRIQDFRKGGVVNE